MGHNLCFIHSRTHMYKFYLLSGKKRCMQGSALGLFFILDYGINLVNLSNVEAI